MTHHFLLYAATTFLLLFIISPPATNAAVFDLDGDLVLANENYYILPVIRGRGGGLTMSPKNNTICPLFVAQAGLEVSRGLPVRFHPINSKQLPVTTSMDLNIEFKVSTICVTLTGWKVTFDEVTGKAVVGTGGQTGNPGKETLSNWFKIEKAGTGEFDYKIVFCPTVCETCRPACGDVSVSVDEDGKRWLVLSDKPLLVMFKKVSDCGTSTQSVISA